MDRPVTVNEGTLVWSGEHWINAIRPDGAETPSAWLSLFHTRFSPVGEGNAAQVRIPGNGGLSLICTDNRQLSQWIIERFFSRSAFHDPDATIVAAQFRLEGDIRKNPTWVIETDDHVITARWQVSQPPVIADGSFAAGTEHFTLLFFTDQASVELDGRPIAGRPFSRDLWKPTIGGQRSSCVFALAETLIELPS